MPKTNYEGPIEGIYASKEFYNLIGQLKGSRLLVNQTDFNQDKTKAHTVSSWTLDKVIILYHSEGLSAKVLLYGSSDKSIKAVEKKIQEKVPLSKFSRSIKRFCDAFYGG